MNLLIEDMIAETSVLPEIVAAETAVDSEMRQISRFLKEGWLARPSSDLEMYFRRKDDLRLEKGCVMWNNRVVIPKSLRTHVLNLLHTTHAGIFRMKSEARAHCSWPSPDKDIEQLSANWEACTLTERDPVEAKLQQWSIPPGP